MICINLALAIGSVDTCVAGGGASCARDDGAVTSLPGSPTTRTFLTDPCASELDACLAQIYGAPKATFPGVDGGMAPSGPPRDTSVSCSNSCSSSNDANCDLSPSCSGPSGCTGTCDACSSSGGGGTSSGGGGGCSGDSCGSSSSGCDNGSDGCSGDNCGSGNSGCSGGGCNNSGNSNSGCGGGGGGGGGGQCSAARGDASAGAALVVSILWALMPIPFAAVIRRRTQPRTRRAAEVAR